MFLLIDKAIVNLLLLYNYLLQITIIITNMTRSYNRLAKIMTFKHFGT